MQLLLCWLRWRARSLGGARQPAHRPVPRAGRPDRPMGRFVQRGGGGRRNTRLGARDRLPCPEALHGPRRPLQDRPRGRLGALLDGRNTSSAPPADASGHSATPPPSACSATWLGRSVRSSGTGSSSTTTAGNARRATAGACAPVRTAPSPTFTDRAPGAHPPRRPHQCTAHVMARGQLLLPGSGGYGIRLVFGTALQPGLRKPARTPLRTRWRCRGPCPRTRRLRERRSRRAPALGSSPPRNASRST